MRRISKEICSVSDCLRPIKAKNLCTMHYKRKWRNGDENLVFKRYTPPPYKVYDEFTAEIELTQGYTALVDIEDAERISQFVWSPTIIKRLNHDYVRATRRDPTYGQIYMQHEVLFIFPGDLEEDQLIDHLDRNPLNNRKNNLQITTHTENMRNTSRHLDRLGFSFNKRANLWIVYLDSPGNKRIYLGYRKTQEEAEVLAKSARFGE